MSESRPRAASPDEKPYVLGTGDDELARLGFQHRLWTAYATDLWERAGFTLGQTITDLGCGPGFATTDLAQLVGSTGRVIAIDESARFLDYLQARVRQGVWGRSLNVEVVQSDVHSLPIPSACTDGLYARWLMCFVRNPGQVVAEIARCLRPGGVVAIQDYFNYRFSLALAPRCKILEQVVEATDKSWRLQGGDPDIAGRLPALLQSAGLRVREVRPISRSARPGSALWEWPGTFFAIFVPKLVEMGLLTPSQHDEWSREWAARSADPASFFITPLVCDIIAEKP